MVVEYDGTEFAGFQLQGKGERTVQAVLESAIEQVSGRFCRIHGAGRTDAGVHAIGQVVHFDTDWGIPAERIGIVLNNGVLPPDVGIRESRDARTGFHARFSATSRIYRYSILNRITPAVMAGRYALVVRDGRRTYLLAGTVPGAVLDRAALQLRRQPPPRREGA